MENNLYRIETTGIIEKPDMNGNAMLYCDGGIAFVKLHPVRISAKPKADTVSKALYEQIKWERDIAISQLESYGVGLGEQADVGKVTYGCWVKKLHKDPRGDYHLYHCSLCDEPSAREKNYCPNCGAKMDL